MQTAEEKFGPLGNPNEMARAHDENPTTSAAPAMATTTQTNRPAHSAVGALVDPRGSAIFWVTAAAILGLLLVSGELKVSAALRGKAGR